MRRLERVGHLPSSLEDRMELQQRAGQEFDEKLEKELNIKNEEAPEEAEQTARRRAGNDVDRLEQVRMFVAQSTQENRRVNPAHRPPSCRRTMSNSNAAKKRCTCRLTASTRQSSTWRKACA